MSDYFLHIIYHHKQDAGIVWNINQLKVDLIVGEKPRKGCEGSHDSLEGDDRLFHIAVKEEDRRSRETVKTYVFFNSITKIAFFLTILLSRFSTCCTL